MRHRGRFFCGENMRKLRATAMLLLLTLIATGAAAQARGDGRIAGKVVDNDSGQPLADVQVKGTLAGQAQPVVAKSNKKGEFNLNGIGSGEWTLEFTKDGFDPQGGKITVDGREEPRHHRQAGQTRRQARSRGRVERQGPGGHGADAGAEIRRGPQDLRRSAGQVSRRASAERLHRPELRRREQHAEGDRVHEDRLGRRIPTTPR